MTRPRLQEVQHAPGHRFLRVEGVQGAGARQGVTGEEALVEHLPAAEGAARDVPGQAEELDAIAGGGGIGGQVALDVRGQRTAEVRLARGDHEAAGPQELQDLHHPRIGGHEVIAGDLHGQPGRAHHAPLVELGIGLGGPQAGPHQLGVQHQLAQALLGVGQLGIPQGLGHEQGHPQDELALGQVLGRALVGGVHRRVGGEGRAVDERDVAEQEHPLPGHQHVVEEDDAVHLLEARAQRVVEVRPPQVEALATQEPEARRRRRGWRS